MTNVQYQRFAPSESLAPYIEHYWTVTASGEAQPRREILIPNGRPMLLLSFAASSVRIDPAHGTRIVNGNTLSEITSQPFVIEQSGESCYLGVQFRPYALAAFTLVRRPINQLLPLAEWLGEREADALTNVLRSVPFGAARVEALDGFLQAKLNPLDAITLQMLAAAIERMEAGSEHLKIDDLPGQFNMHYTTFYRAFKSHVGLSPKRFLSIVRYYRFVGDLLTTTSHDPNALLAALEGYYDQAHASKAFRQFTGVTPNTFRETLNGIARLMHQV